MKLIDLINKRFGKLVVIARAAGYTTDGNGVRWLCKCDCGSQKVIYSKPLRSGNTKSCGCLKRLAYGKGSMRRLIYDYKEGARERGISFELTEEQFEIITKQSCFYCGRAPSQVKKGGRSNGMYIFNGIDRVDSFGGYTINNCVPCCKECNYAKSNRSQNDFLLWIKRVYNHRFGHKEIFEPKESRSFVN